MTTSAVDTKNHNHSKTVNRGPTSFQASRKKIISCSGIFYFLWGDWLFSDEARQEQLPSTIEDRDLRRDVILKAITDYNERSSGLLSDINKLRASQEEAQRLCLISLWEVLQLRQHVSEEILEQIRVDKQVNQLDPDFSFEKAVEAMLYGAP